ncbi:hypothetical protein F8568_042205 [Actinomadura sp. LD22]|uniref:Uncharacterized protein n=1 Tax=Actinomadura physcomitrii TaxID=2650748 RepID=A0A6I4MW11_9ACTN|nr:hypothetical protein [Actinomadura physcomitrii]MWA06849.1 hypothetical protein [Actinomadura physcomitrii]
MIRERPESALEMLRDLKGIDIPPTPLVRVESNTFNDRPSKDFTPDTVISAGPPQQPFHGLIVEVQQEPSEAKRKQLPRYAASLWLMLNCPVTLLCICPDAATAKFFAKPITTELPGYVLEAVVLGPDDVPAISDASEAATHPEVAVLSVLVHREQKVAEAFVGGLSLMSDDHATQYYEYAYGMASLPVRRTLEELMTSTNWPVYSPFAREHFGRGKSEGLAEGRAEGRIEGRAEGRTEGRAEGRTEGRAEALLLLLEARNLNASGSVIKRILLCKDTEMLEKWIRRAALIEKVEDLFD